MRLTTAAKLPPALSPPTARRSRPKPRAAACCATHEVAAKQSSTAAGNLCSGGTVIDRNDDAPDRIGEMAAKAVMRVEIADHPTAPMEIDECGEYFAGRRCHAAVQPQWDGHAGWPRCRELASFGDWRRIARQHLACREKQFARFGRAQRPVGRSSGQPHHFETALGIAIERHHGLL